MAYELSSAPHFGRAGGPTTQMVRENWAVSSSAPILVASGNGTTAQAMLPVTTGSDYYLIWGWTVATNNNDAVYGYIQTTSVAAPEMIVGAFAVTSQGPMFMNFPMPLKVAPGEGVQCKMLATISSDDSIAPDPKVLPIVYYTRVEV